MRRSATLLVALLAMASAVTAAMKVEVARTAGVDYSSYTSFAFRPKEGIPPEHPLGENGEIFTRVSQTGTEALESRGMTVADGGEPDVWITVFGLVDEDLAIEGTRWSAGGNVSWIGDPGAHSMRTILEGTLVIELWDAATDKRIWSGWATDKSKNREKLRSRLEPATRRILAELPRD